MPRASCGIVRVFVFWRPEGTGDRAGGKPACRQAGALESGARRRQGLWGSPCGRGPHRCLGLGLGRRGGLWPPLHLRDSSVAGRRSRAAAGRVEQRIAAGGGGILRGRWCAEGTDGGHRDIATCPGPSAAHGSAALKDKGLGPA